MRLRRFAVAGALGALACALGGAPLRAASKDVDPVAASDADYRKRLETCDADDVAAQRALAAWCLKARLPERARERFRRVVELVPDDAEARAAVGEVLRGDVWVTRRAARRLDHDARRRAVPEGDVAALLQVADAALRDRLLDQAEDVYRDVLALDPANEAARHALDAEPTTPLERAVVDALGPAGKSRDRAEAALESAPALDPEAIGRWMLFVRARLRRLPHHEGGDVETLRDPACAVRYRVVVNRKGAGLSLAVLLHGGGPSREVNDGAWDDLRYLAEGPFDVVAIPRVLDDTTGAGWIVESGPRIVEQLLHEVLRAHPIDTNRVFLHGYSMGGYGGAYLGALAPDRFAAVGVGAAGWCSGGARVGNFLHLPVALHIGAEDRESDHVGTSREFRGLLDAARAQRPWGYPLEYVEYPGVGHQLPMEDAPRAFAWMAERSRDPDPVRVVWEPFSTQLYPTHRPWCWWLGADAFTNDARAEAVVVGDTVHVTTTRGFQGLTLYLDEDVVDVTHVVNVMQNGKGVFRKVPKASLATLVRTFAARNDPELTYAYAVPLR